MNFKYFSILFELPTIDSSTKILILKNIFYFLKSVKVGYLNYLLLIQQKNFNFRHIFYFLKIVKGGPLTNIFAIPANFNRPLYQSQDLIRTLNIFRYYLSYLLLIQHKNFNFKPIFYFQKIVKGGPLKKIFCNSCKL